jgi:hypothetical protein
MLAAPQVGLLVCRYDGPPARTPPELAAAAALLGSPAARLAEQVNALPSIGQSEPSCPAPVRTAMVTVTGLGPVHRAPVVANLACPVVTNGTRRALASDDLGDALSALTG